MACIFESPILLDNIIRRTDCIEDVFEVPDGVVFADLWSLILQEFFYISFEGPGVNIVKACHLGIIVEPHLKDEPEFNGGVMPLS